jgi:hypothetical protein
MKDGLQFVACPNEVVFNTELKDCQPISQPVGISDSGDARESNVSLGSAEITQQKYRDEGTMFSGKFARPASFADGFLRIFVVTPKK